MKPIRTFEPSGLMRHACFIFGFFTVLTGIHVVISLPSGFSQTSLGNPLSTTMTQQRSASMIRLEPLDGESKYPPVVTALAVSKDRQWLVAAGDDHALRVIRLADGQTTATLQGHRDWVQAIAFDDQSRDILSCGKDGELRRWKVEASWEAEVIHRGEVALMTISLSAPDRIIACAGFGPAIWIYSLETNLLLKELTCSCSDSRALAFSHSGDMLACGGRDGTVRVWDWNRSTLLCERVLHRDRIRSIQFSGDDAEIITIGEDRRAVGYHHANDQVVLDQTLATGRLLSMVALDNSITAIAGSDNTIRLMRTTDGSEMNRLIGHEGSVAVMVSAGDMLISGSFDTTIRLWDLGQVAQERRTSTGRYEHPVSARFQNSGIDEANR